MPAKTVDDLPSDATIMVSSELPQPLEDMPNQLNGLRVSIEVGTVDHPSSVGSMTIVRRSLDSGQWWLVEKVAAESGWGPLIYEFAMEYVTKKEGWLTAWGGHLTSDEALAVWNFFSDRRRTELKFRLLPHRLLAGRSEPSSYYGYQKDPPTTMNALAGRTIFKDAVVG